ncbi:MarR family winged helix-turn-helix transcriptional regulator [Arenibaculum pallidiluteum]|uniref:MarR family winged helix-turn-helix transcriptional regulator n=1 Tax=Arenibaculum pallidiluteum TaxID=2812559 RepID=UPI001A961449|nr:MarR family transcriptional regulator [Arenibaculum pallidiluteum]
MEKVPPADSFGFLLSDAARLMRRRFDQKARDLGLTRAQWQLLARLARNEGANQSSLADLLDVEPITLCRLVDRMEEGGWVSRRPDPADRRARLLFMTDKARPVLARMRALAEEVHAEGLEGLDPGVRAIMAEGLARLRANLSDRQPEHQPELPSPLPDQRRRREGLPQ